MAKNLAGLQNCNPVFTSTNTSLFSTMGTVYSLCDNKDYYKFDIKALLEWRQKLYKLFQLSESLDFSFEDYQQKVICLLKTTQKLSPDDENFMSNLHTVELLVTRVSMFFECKKIFIENYEILCEIYKKAQELQQVNESYPANYYAVSLQFLKAKFYKEADFDEEELLEALQQRFFKDEVNIAFLADISLYKNCDRFDLSFDDLVNLCSDNNWWIYEPYINRYKKQIHDTMFSLCGDDIYSNWFSFVTSKKFLGGNGCIKYIIESLEAFSAAGIYTYDAALLLKAIKQKKGDDCFETNSTEA